MGSQCAAPTRKGRNLVLFQMALSHIKTSMLIKRRGRAKGFLIKIVPVVTANGR